MEAVQVFVLKCSWKTKLGTVTKYMYFPPLAISSCVLLASSSILWVGLSHGSTERQRTWGKRRRWDPFSSFERSDIWNKEPSYVSSSVWDRQTDRGQILPARQINRPRRVGSLRDDSFIHTHTHTHTGKQEHTHTKYILFMLKTSLKTSHLRGESRATVQICREMLHGNVKGNKYLVVTFTRLSWRLVLSVAQVKVFLLGLPVWPVFLLSLIVCVRRQPLFSLAIWATCQTK